MSRLHGRRVIRRRHGRRERKRRAAKAATAIPITSSHGAERCCLPARIAAAWTCERPDCGGSVLIWDGEQRCILCARRWYRPAASDEGERPRPAQRSGALQALQYPAQDFSLAISMHEGTITAPRKRSAIRARVGPTSQSAAPMSATPPITRATMRLYRRRAFTPPAPAR